MSPSQTRRRLLLGAAALTSGVASPVLFAASAFRLAYFETYSPFSFHKGAEMQGLLVDILQTVLGSRMGLEVQHTGYPWLRAQNLVQAGSEDAICTIPSDERLIYAVASEEPVLVAPLRLYTRADNPHYARLAQVRSLDELRSLNLNVLSYVGNGWAKQNLAGFEVDWGGNFVNAVQKLMAGRGDVMIENSVSMDYTLKTLGATEVKALPGAFGNTYFHLLIGKKSSQLALLPRFDAALRKFKTEPGYKAILAAY